MRSFYANPDITVPKQIVAHLRAVLEGVLDTDNVDAARSSARGAWVTFQDVYADDRFQWTLDYSPESSDIFYLLGAMHQIIDGLEVQRVTDMDGTTMVPIPALDLAAMKDIAKAAIEHLDHSGPKVADSGLVMPDYGAGL